MAKSRYVYIHNQYYNFEEQENIDLTQLYSKVQIQRQYYYGIAKIKRQLRLLNQMENKELNINDAEFFALLEDAKQGIEKSAQQMVNQIKMPDTSHSELKGGNLDVYMGDIQKIVMRFRDIAKLIVENSNIIDKHPEIYIMNKDFFTSGTFHKGTEIKQAYRDAFLRKNQGSFINITSDNYTGTRATYIENIKKIIMNVKALDELEEMYKNNTYTNFMSDSLYSDTYSSLLYSLLGIFNTMLGFISEEGLESALNNQKTMEKFLGLSFDSFTAKTTGNESSGGLFNKNTQDVSVSLNFSKMLEGGEIGRIIVKIPGISIKRTNIVANKKTSLISLKKNTTLGKLITSAGEQIGTRQLKAFFNSYANYNRQFQLVAGGRKYKSQLSKDEQPSMENMYNYMNAAFLPHALGGALNAQDFGYYFIINNRVYTMIEIIEMILNREGETTLVSNLQQRQYSAKVTHTQNFQELSTNAMIRSQKTYDAIRGLSITMKLNLAASKIK